MSRYNNMLKFIITSLVTLNCLLASSQNFELKSNSINNGSGTAVSTSFQLNGAVGEIIGSSSSSSFVLNTGSISNRVTATVDPGLIAYYPLNGDFLDASGNGYDAVSFGTVALHADVAGLADRAYYFDGVESQVYHTLADPINFTGFTLSAWVIFSDPANTNYQHIMGLESYNSSSQLVQLAAVDGSFVLYQEDNDGGNELGAQTFGTVGYDWQHVVVTWDGTIVSGYVDGVLVETYDATFSLNIDVEELNLGSNIAWGDFMDGVIDEAKFYNYALTEEEVFDLFNSYPSPPTMPQNVVAKVVGPGSIQLTWDDGPDETFYEVYWEDPGSNYDYVDLPAGETTYTITGLATDVEYYIEVVAWNDYTGNDYNNSYAYDYVYQTPVDKGPIQAASFPAPFILDEDVTIQFYPQLSYPVGDLDVASKIYMYAGLIAPEDVESGNWSYTVGTWGVDDGIGQMTLNGGVWEITINPRTYFNAPDNFIAAQIAMVFTNEDGTLIGKAADLADIKLDIFDPTTISPIGGFLATDANTDVYIDDGTTFFPSNVQLENFSEFTMEALINFGDVNPTIGTFQEIIARGFDNGSTYTPLHGAVYYTYDGITAYPTGLITSEISAIPYPNYILPETGVDVSGIGGGEAYSNGTWAHIALVYSTPSYGYAELYINGINQGFVDIFDPTSTANMLRIGQFDGAVDELRFWNYARTQDDLRINMKNEIDPVTSGLIGYWKMNGTTNISGTDYILDETTSANDFVVGNAVITQLPDLDVISLGLNPKSIAQGETLSMSYTIENIGPADAGAFDLDFYLSTDINYDGPGTDVFLTTTNFSSGLLTGESVFNIIQATIPDVATAPNGDYYVIAVLDDLMVVEEENETNNTASAALNIDAINLNKVTTSITLDNYSFQENAAIGTKVGGIFYDDPDDDLFDISLVGSTNDNALFQIVGGELLTNSVRDFETDATSYTVSIQVDDNRGGVWAEDITINLTDINESPTDITLSNSTIIAGGTYFEHIVGMLETVDQDLSDSHTYTITIEDNANASFLIDGSGNLKITVNNPSVSDAFTLTIQSEDQGSLIISKEFSITVEPANAPPNGLLLTNNTINESNGATAVIGQFYAQDDDSDNFTYALASGGTDNAEFSVSSTGVLTQNNDNLAAGTYSIRVIATDDSGISSNSITRTFSIRVIADAVSNVISIGGAESNYRIIGVPFKNATIGSTFPDLTNDNNLTEWRMFGFNNGSTSELKSTGSNLTNGNGYWFISTIQQSVTLPAGNVNTAPTVPKSLQSGWNLIGNPFLTTLDWATVLSFNENVSGSISSGDVGAQIFTWNGSWNQTTTLGVMQGGFVNVANASSSFAYPSATASLGTARATANERIVSSYFDNSNAWQLYLNLESKGISSNISGVGLNQISIDEQDGLDIAPPPTPSIFDPLQLTEKATGLTKNIKAVNKSVFWDFILTGTKESTTISWDQYVANQADEPLIIALLPQGEMYDMGSVGEITFTPEKNQSVMVIYGKELPKELLFNAITAYPNPADQEVNFRFFVDEEGSLPATVELFNLGGQQLGTINQMVSGGHWNEINYKVGSQDLLKSGIYLFKVKYSDFESAVKKIIIK
ncbi:MAG: LamG-like jellyroll fold domain-containing protein [Bacteroidota bacterium]